MTITRRGLAAIAGAALCTPSIRSASAAEPGVSDREVRIGSYLPLQGGLAAGASQYRDGAASYFRWVNEQGGVNGRQIVWTVENDGYNPQQAVAAARKLVDRDGVLAIVSTLGTTTNLAALPFLKQRNVPLVAPLASHPLMNKPEDRIVFPLSPLGTLHGSSLARFAAADLKARRIAVLYQDDQYGKELLEGVEAHATETGLAIAARATYVPSDVDLSTQAATLSRSNADAVVMAVIPRQGALMLLEAQKLGWRTNFLAPQTMGDEVAKQLAGDAINGLYLNLYCAVDTMDTPMVRQAMSIIPRYAPQTRPGYWSFIGMAGAVAFVEGLKAAGRNLSRASLMDGLESLGRVDTGLVPILDYGAGKHSGPTDVGFGQWRGGRVEVVRGWAT